MGRFYRDDTPFPTLHVRFLPDAGQGGPGLAEPPPFRPMNTRGFEGHFGVLRRYLQNLGSEVQKPNVFHRGELRVAAGSLRIQTPYS